jgi:haloacetate dehalogenase
VPDAPRAEGDMAGMLGSFPGLWFFEPRPLAEQVVSLAPEAWFNDHQDGQPRAPGWMHPSALSDYLAMARDPASMAAMKESFRAAATIDRLQMAVARAQGRRIACETVVLWGTHGHLGGWYDPRAAWQAVCAGRVSGLAIEAGHYLAEQAPQEVIDVLMGAESHVAVA